jgi:hypothetical protein
MALAIELSIITLLSGGETELCKNVKLLNGLLLNTR